MERRNGGRDNAIRLGFDLRTNSTTNLSVSSFLEASGLKH
jgi:hypothetical protein